MDQPPADSGHLHGELLVQVAHETVAASDAMQHIFPLIPMTSPAARHLHELVYTICTIETLVHQFIDQQLLSAEASPPNFRRRESGAKLQDTLEHMRDATILKPAVKASLLSGGIASLLYLFSILLRDLNIQLQALPDIEAAATPNVAEAACAVGAAALGSLLQLSTASSLTRRFFTGAAAVGGLVQRERRRLPISARGGEMLGRSLLAGAAAYGARALYLEAARRRAAKRLAQSESRLSLTLRLWCLATSVLQRAHRQGVSYTQLGHLHESSNVQRVASFSSLAVMSGVDSGGGSLAGRSPALSLSATQLHDGASP